MVWIFLEINKHESFKLIFQKISKVIFMTSGAGPWGQMEKSIVGVNFYLRNVGGCIPY